MAYYHVQVLGILEDKDNDGNVRFRAEVVECKPRKFLVNLKDNTAAINLLTSLVGRNVMLPAKENQMNGQIYLGLIPGDDILPMPDTKPTSPVDKPVSSAVIPPSTSTQSAKP